MGQGAKVTSIAALREFRPALIKFVEEARASLIAAESECNRTLEWLRRDRTVYWKKEKRRREDEIVRCKTELMNKQRSATGDPRSAVEERKALDRAKHRLEEAIRKQADTKHWLRQLEKEQMQYKGMAQALNGQVTRLEDRAIHDLDRMAEALDEYVSMAVPTNSELGEAPRPPGFGEGEGFSAAVSSLGDHAAVRSPFASYRLATPSPGRRRRAESNDFADDLPVHSLGRTDGRKQEDALAALLMDQPLAEGATLSMSRGAFESERIYLERVTPIDEQDSGWYVAGAPDGAPNADRRELLRVPIVRILAFRPGLEPALRLCEGTLIVASGSLVESVTAANDTLVYEASVDPRGGDGI